MDSSAQRKLRVLILDDHPTVRRGVRQTLAEAVDFLEFGGGNCGPEGLALAVNHPWNLVILCGDVPDREARRLRTALHQRLPHTSMVILIIRERLPNSASGLAASLAGKIAVTRTPEELIAAVRRAIVQEGSGQSAGLRETPASAWPHFESGNGKMLSGRESDVLQLLALGTPVKEIAALLKISNKTVSTYRSRLLTKLGLKTTAELIRYAVLAHLGD